MDNTNTLTVIVREASSPCPPIYPDPLIYSVQVSLSADAAEILEAVAVQRCADLGLDPEENSGECYEVKDGLELLFAFYGDLNTAFDWRT